MQYRLPTVPQGAESSHPFPVLRLLRPSSFSRGSRLSRRQTLGPLEATMRAFVGAVI